MNQKVEIVETKQEVKNMGSLPNSALLSELKKRLQTGIIDDKAVLKILSELNIVKFDNQNVKL